MRTRFPRLFPAPLQPVLAGAPTVDRNRRVNLAMFSKSKSRGKSRKSSGSSGSKHSPSGSRAENAERMNMGLVIVVALVCLMILGLIAIILFTTVL